MSATSSSSSSSSDEAAPSQSSSSSSSNSKSAPLKPIITPIDLGDAMCMELRAENCELLMAGIDYQQRFLYDMLPWQITLGKEYIDPMHNIIPADSDDEDDDVMDIDDDDIEDEKKTSKKKTSKKKKKKADPTLMDYQNTPAFKTAWARHDQKRRFYEQLFPVSILRKRKDMVRYAEDVIIHRAAAPTQGVDDDLAIPCRWERWDPNMGSLVWVEEQTSGARYYKCLPYDVHDTHHLTCDRYLPKEEKLLDIFDFVTYRHPGYKGKFEPDIIVDMTMIRPLGALIPGIEGMPTAALPSQSSAHASAPMTDIKDYVQSQQSSGAMARLPCAYRPIFMQEDAYAAALINVNDASFEAAHPTSDLIMKSARDLMPDSINEEIRLASDDMADAQIKRRYQLMSDAFLNFKRLLRAHQMEELEALGVMMPGSMPSKSTRVAMRYDRRLPSHSAIPWADGVASISRPAPVIHQDPLIMWEELAVQVARRMGCGITAADLMGRPLRSVKENNDTLPLPMAAVSALASTSGSTGAGTAADAERLVLMQEKRIEDFLPVIRGAQAHIAFFYQLTFAWLDLAQFTEILEDFDENMRGNLFELLTRRPSAGTTNTGSVRKRQREIAMAMGKGDLNVFDMRHALAKKLLSKEFTPISIKFDLGQRARKAEELMMPHDALDPAIMEAHQKSAAIVAAAGKDTLIDPKSVSQTLNTLLGVKTKPLSKGQAEGMIPDVPPPAPAGPGGAKPAGPAKPMPSLPPPTPAVIATAKRKRGDDSDDAEPPAKKPNTKKK